MTKEWQAASNEKALEQKQNPITGRSSPPYTGYSLTSCFQVSRQKDTRARVTFKANRQPPSAHPYGPNGTLHDHWTLGTRSLACSFGSGVNALFFCLEP